MIDFYIKIYYFYTKMIEFHMSDRDLNLSPGQFLNNSFEEIDLIVHGVEQFEDGFIFDLASSDEQIINRSLSEIDRLSSHINSLRPFFNESKQIPVVINIGGHSKKVYWNEGGSEVKVNMKYI